MDRLNWVLAKLSEITNVTFALIGNSKFCKRTKHLSESQVANYNKRSLTKNITHHIHLNDSRNNQIIPINVQCTRFIDSLTITYRFSEIIKVKRHYAISKLINIIV